ncbi:AraC family transcriptional regulator [Alkalibacillus haloalkaliphilus]|uniref:AraC family transcriptional regulator n=1 Tax=Alkalibacillus haloalkaliphilus TaxID=94136 RepID=UPI0029355F91|nr:AraC family transcriptional regulator [Alkalibacillus haloalkaliphilus]MDV2581759.1 AraC family transcriptional regulator [Alkalibacillus haloalkaliphilus]
MESLKQMNEAIEYIEKHLDGEIDYSQLAQKAQCSEYHFKRMFSFLAGIPLSEYIRRRRMTLAAMELNRGENKIIDIALKYGYSSPNSFARAFQQVHGLMPSEIKEQSYSLKSYPKLTFQLTVRGVDEMNVRMIEKEPFSIVGIKQKMKVMDNDVDPEVVKLWESTTEDTIQKLVELSDLQPSGILHALTDYTSDDQDENESEIDYFFGVATTRATPSPYTRLEVSKHTWAIFEVEGDWEAVETTWQRIYSEWFPSSKYEHVEGPEIVSSKDEVSEIWIPVRKA